MTRSLFSPLIRCTGSLLAAGLIVVQTEAAEPNQGAKSVQPSSAAVQPAKKFKPDGTPAKLNALIPGGSFEVAADGVYHIHSARSEEFEKILKKLEAIVIPKLNIEDKTLPEALKILTEKSKEADAEKQGMVFELTGYNPAKDDAIKISFNAEKIPLIEGVKFVTLLTEHEFEITPPTVTLSRFSGVIVDDSVTRWEVRPDFIARLHKRFAPDVPVPSDAKAALEASGVPFVEGMFAGYSKDDSLLTVKGAIDTAAKVGAALLAADAGCNPEKVALSVYDENDVLIYRRPTNGEPVWKPVPLKAGKRYRFSSLGCAEPTLWLEPAAAK